MTTYRGLERFVVLFWYQLLTSYNAVWLDDRLHVSNSNWSSSFIL